MTSEAPTGGVITGLTGVYHARGTLTGELAYWVGARLGRAHCALCDITHGTFRAKPAFAAACRDGVPVPFALVHLDERTPAVATATDGQTPCVVAEVAPDDAATVGSEANDGGAPRLVLLLGPEDLEVCGGDPDAFVVALTAAAATRSLRWAPPSPT